MQRYSLTMMNYIFFVAIKYLPVIIDRRRDNKGNGKHSMSTVYGL
jgi:hypothetical protein